MNTEDEKDAPAGFRAIEKPSFDEVKESICRSCDWREKCCDPSTDFGLPQHKCMGYARSDGVGVIFKKVQEK